MADERVERKIFHSRTSQLSNKVHSRTLSQPAYWSVGILGMDRLRQSLTPFIEDIPLARTEGRPLRRQPPRFCEGARVQRLAPSILAPFWELSRGSALGDARFCCDAIFSVAWAPFPPTRSVLAASQNNDRVSRGSPPDGVRSDRLYLGQSFEDRVRGPHRRAPQARPIRASFSSPIDTRRETMSSTTLPWAKTTVPRPSP